MASLIIFGFMILGACVMMAGEGAIVLGSFVCGVDTNCVITLGSAAVEFLTLGSGVLFSFIDAASTTVFLILVCSTLGELLTIGTMRCGSTRTGTEFCTTTLAGCCCCIGRKPGGGCTMFVLASGAKSGVVCCVSTEVGRIAARLSSCAILMYAFFV